MRLGDVVGGNLMLPIIDGCIYCAGTRGSLPGTVEHIWPKSLGGDYGGEFFTTNQVCAKCNHDCGLWVDGGFVKSFFIQSERSLSEMDFLDPTSDLCVSLVYLGHEESFPCDESEICERWIGPSGDHIYHIHQRDHPKWHSHAGGNIIARKRRDAGRTYVRLVDQGEQQMIVSIRSIKKHFKKSRVHILAEFVDQNFEKNAGLIAAINRTKFEETEITWITKRPQCQANPISSHIDINLPRRFLAKIALGFGSKLLGDAFLHSRDAEALRSALWPDAGFGCESEVYGSDFLESRDGLASRLLSWPSAWSLHFSFDQEVLGLTVATPKGQMATIRIADVSCGYSDASLSDMREGLTFIFVPGRRACLGPVTTPDFLAHRLGKLSNSVLSAAEKWSAETAAYLNPQSQIAEG